MKPEPKITIRLDFESPISVNWRCENGSSGYGLLQALPFLDHGKSITKKLLTEKMLWKKLKLDDKESLAIRDAINKWYRSFDPDDVVSFCSFMHSRAYRIFDACLLKHCTVTDAPVWKSSDECMIYWSVLDNGKTKYTFNTRWGHVYNTVFQGNIVKYREKYVSMVVKISDVDKCYVGKRIIKRLMLCSSLSDGEKYVKCLTSDDLKSICSGLHKWFSDNQTVRLFCNFVIKTKGDDYNGELDSIWKRTEVVKPTEVIVVEPTDVVVKPVEAAVKPVKKVEKPIESPEKPVSDDEVTEGKPTEKEPEYTTTEIVEPGLITKITRDGDKILLEEVKKLITLKEEESPLIKTSQRFYTDGKLARITNRVSYFTGESEEMLFISGISKPIANSKNSKVVVTNITPGVMEIFYFLANVLIEQHIWTLVKLKDKDDRVKIRTGLFKDGELYRIIKTNRVFGSDTEVDSEIAPLFTS